jgi:hypothetical protein
MTKLNQVIAVEKGIKSRVHAAMGDIYKSVQKPELFNGFVKTYEKKNEEGEDLPSEKKVVQLTTDQVINVATKSLTDLFDITAAKDWTNCTASGTVAIDGQELIKDVPVSYLLFLEKQLTDLRTFVGAIPVLDNSENWNLDENSGLFKTEASKTHRTKKVQKALVLYPATDKHPAQTAQVTEDEIAGFWAQVKHSGAMQKPKKEALEARIEKLLRAIKEAREAANNVDVVETPNISSTVFSYIFGDK